MDTGATTYHLFYRLRTEAPPAATWLAEPLAVVLGGDWAALPGPRLDEMCDAVARTAAAAGLAVDVLALADALWRTATRPWARAGGSRGAELLEPDAAAAWQGLLGLLGAPAGRLAPMPALARWATGATWWVLEAMVLPTPEGVRIERRADGGWWVGRVVPPRALLAGGRLVVVADVHGEVAYDPATGQLVRTTTFRPMHYAPREAAVRGHHAGAVLRVTFALPGDATAPVEVGPFDAPDGVRVGFVVPPCEPQTLAWLPGLQLARTGLSLLPPGGWAAPGAVELIAAGGGQPAAQGPTAPAGAGPQWSPRPLLSAALIALLGAAALARMFVP